MRNITLEKAFKLLDNASAIILDDEILVYQSLSGLTDEDDNEFLFVTWSDYKGDEYYNCFRQGENEIIEISDSSMFLTDTEGDLCKITILTEKKIT